MGRGMVPLIGFFCIKNCLFVQPRPMLSEKRNCAGQELRTRIIRESLQDKEEKMANLSVGRL